MKIWPAAVLALTLFLSACAGRTPIAGQSSPEISAANDADVSQAGTRTAGEDSPGSESVSEPPETEPVLSDDTVILGDLTFSLYENRQDFTAKLTGADISYTYSAVPGSDSSGSYRIGQALTAYFENDICVRFRFWNEAPQTGRGIRKGDSYAQMTKQYGEPHDQYTLHYKGEYDAYVYSFDDCVCEFGIARTAPDADSFYNIDVYIPDLFPAYTDPD